MDPKSKLGLYKVLMLVFIFSILLCPPRFMNLIIGSHFCSCATGSLVSYDEPYQWESEYSFFAMLVFGLDRNIVSYFE